jgi:putative transcriptional regulator
MIMNLKKLREESGIKAYKVAEKLGISRVQLNNIEKGKCKLDTLKIEKLSEIYGKSINEIELACEVTRGEPRRNNV